MSQLDRAGISVDVPAGWEASIDGGGFPQLESGAVRPTLLHMGTFPLPPDRGSFGSGATELMNTDDIMIVLFEYSQDSADTPLFATRGIPRSLEPDDFDRQTLQHALPGQSGVQRFFTDSGRPFSLYVVLGSHLDRFELVPRVNEVLATLEIT